MTDSESASADFAAGILDIDSVWRNAGGTGGGSSITLSDPEGQKTLEINQSGNPSYVWFRTKCKQCEEDEEKLNVRFGLATTSGQIDWLDEFEDGYMTLRDARELLGEGYLLGEFEPDGTRNLVVDWETEELTDDLDVTLNFGLYAAQRRHVMNAASVGPAKWEGKCNTPCGTTTSSGSGGISWIAFCCSDDISPDDVTIEFSNDGQTILIVDAPDIEIGAILLKYGLNLDVFWIDAGDSVVDQQFTTGGAPKTYRQKTGNAGKIESNGSNGENGNNDDVSRPKRNGGYFPGTETTPSRSNDNPCPGSNWIKYDVDDDRWYPGDGETEEVD